MLTKFKNKILEIKEELTSLGNSIIKASEITFVAMQDDDLEKFAEARELLKNVNDIASDIDNKIVTTLALQSPEARDLREMVSYLKITNELIRAATNIRSMSKGIKSKFSNEDLDKIKIRDYAKPLHECSLEALKTAVEMIKCCEDSEILEKMHQKVLVEESKTDDLYIILEKNILTIVCKDYELSKDYLDTLSSLRKLEKVADRSASIANLILFAEIGGKIKE